MKQITRILICFLMGLPAVNWAALFGNPYISKATMTIRVVDEIEQPVSNAWVWISFSQGKYDSKKQEDVPAIHEGMTDMNGFFSAEDNLLHPLCYSIRKKGWYTHYGNYAFKRNRETKKWDPPYVTNTVVLKEIKNPIPMYVKRVEAEIPVEDQPVGFDLEKGNWVSPYGNGVKGDFLITFSRKKRSNNDFDLYITVGFSNEGDGIREIDIENPRDSELRMPYEAPKNGYQTKWTSHAGQRPNTGYFGPLGSVETINFFYRVRTILDENGNVKETHYGKIHGNFHVRSSLRENPKILFTYYLNPIPNDRNDEFDPDKNLFGGRDRFAP